MIRGILNDEINKAIKNLYPDFDGVLASEKTANAEFGDYSFNVISIASKLGKNPQIIADEIKEKLSASKEFNRIISKTEFTNGFLNFWLSEKGLEEGLKFIQKDKFNFGNNEKVQVEFISANPTGELHIGHGRSAFFGNALSNVLDAAGYEIKREFFINDSEESIQIKGLRRTTFIIKKEKDTAPVEGWKKPYETEYLKKAIKSGKVNFRNVEKEIQKDNQEFITNVLSIKFDKWFSEERELRKKGEFEETLELLKSKGFVEEKDGALWLKTSAYGDNKNEVIVRSSGTYGYFLSDIAYHINKFKRGFDKVIDIWGADHQGHVKRMLTVRKMLGWEGDLDILISQMATIKERGETKKLSKRKGTIILLKDLVKEVGLDAARWFYLEKSLSTHMEFDFALAKERSKKNPVYYVQYAHARACSIIKKSKLKPARSAGGAQNAKQQLKIKNLNKFEHNLIMKLIQFPEIIENISKDYQAHRLTTYVYELAKIFTEFYENVPVLAAETEELKKSRLVLVDASRKILERTLGLMGISAPEKM